MNKLARILAISTLVMIVVVVFVQVSSEPKFLTEYRFYRIILGACYVVIFGLFIWLGVLLSLPRIEVVFGGGVGRPSGDKDHPIHQGGFIFRLIATISNTGGRKLTLETRMVLRDNKTGQRLCAALLMPNVPIPEEEWAEQSNTSKFVGTQLYCPELLELISGDTRKHRFYFFVEGHIVEKLGSEKIGNNIPVPKVSTARQDLEFIDRGLGVVFRCLQTGYNEYECKRSRFH